MARVTRPEYPRERPYGPWHAFRDVTSSNLLFDALGVTTSIDDLDSSLTINSITETPVLRYNGTDAGASTWDAETYGEQLSIAGAGTAPDINYKTPMLKSGESCPFFKGGKYYQGSTTFASMTTEDFVAEVVVVHKNAALTMICGDMWDEDGVGWHGWSVEMYTGTMRVMIGWGTASVKICTATGLTEGSWYHVMFFVDRSGSASSYVNGVYNNAVNWSSAAANSISSANPFTIAARSDGDNLHADRIAHCMMWNRASWLDTHLQPDIAKQRFLKLTGIYPRLATGSYVPSVASRASDATLSEGADVYVVGDNWLRTNYDTGDSQAGYYSRVADVDLLRYVGDDGNINTAGTGTVSCDVIVEASSKGANDLYVFDISDGGSTSDHIALYLDATTGVATVETAATGGNAGSVTGTTDICDGTKHTLAVTWATNVLRLSVDGEQEGTTDTSVDIPNDLDRIDIAVDAGGTKHLDSLIANFKIYDR